MAVITLRNGLGRNLTPTEVDANFTALNNENAAQQVAIDAKAPVLSPALTGAPTSQTPTVDDDSQRIATTEWVIGQASDANPQPNAGTASPGVSTRWARADHVHVGGSGSGSVQNALTPASTTNAPSVDAVNTALAAKANSADISATLDGYNAAINTSLATKEDKLTFFGATRDGNNVSVDPAKVSGTMLDGFSFYMIPGFSGMSVLGPSSGTVTTGTATGAGPNNPTNTWNVRGRGGRQSAAAANSQAREFVQSRTRFPFSGGTLTLGGFKVAMTYVTADALTGCRGWIGALGTLPAAGTALSSYAAPRLGFGYETTDTNLQLYANGTLVKDMGASFPVNGNETNPYLIEFESVPAVSGGAAQYVRWKITHLLSGAVDQGTITTGIPDGTAALYWGVLRETGANTTACQWYSTGVAAGTFYNFVVGEAASIPTPGRITGSTTLTRLQHANVEQKVESATDVVLTVANSGFLDGDQLFGVNEGAGNITFALAGGGTIQKHADLPAAVEQWQGWGLTYNGVASRWVRTA